MRNKLIISSLVLLAAGLNARAQDKVLTLQECKDIAISNSMEVRNAELTVREAKDRRNEVITKFFPNVSANGWAFKSQDYLIQMEVASIFGYSDFGYDVQALWEETYGEVGATKDIKLLNFGRRYGISAIQPVFLGGRIITGTRYANLGIKAAEVVSSLTKRKKLEDVESNYFKVTALLEKAKTVDALHVLVDSLDRIAGIAYDEGLILKADHMLLKTKEMELESGTQKLNAAIKLLKMNLLNSIGMDYNVLDLDKYQFPAASMDDLPSPQSVYRDEEEVAAKTQESELLDMQIQAKKYDKLMTIGSALPAVGVGATYGTAMYSTKRGWQPNGLVFIAMRIPITDWGETSIKLHRQNLALEKAENQKEYLSKMLVLQQRKFYFDLTSAWDALQLAISQKEYSQYLYDQAKISFDAGYTTITDLLQVYTNLSTMQENYCTAISDYLTALQVYRGHFND